MCNLGKKLRESGWRQGVLLPAKQLLRQLPDGKPLTEDHWLLAASQSCDLVHGDLAKEPHAIFLILTSVNEPNPAFEHGRNPRVLHLTTTSGKVLEAWAWNQVTVPREQLLEIVPESPLGLDPRELRVVLEWLAKRYTRVAFPDDFNEALSKKASNIRKLFKKRHHLFSEILLHLEPFENLEEGSSYELACYLVMDRQDYQDEQQLAEAKQAAFQLEKSLEACGLAVQECSPISDADLTLAELKLLVRWDYDYLSNQEAGE